MKKKTTVEEARGRPNRTVRRRITAFVNHCSMWSDSGPPSAGSRGSGYLCLPPGWPWLRTGPPEAASASRIAAGHTGVGARRELLPLLACWGRHWPLLSRTPGLYGRRCDRQTETEGKKKERKII